MRNYYKLLAKSIWKSPQDWISQKRQDYFSPIYLSYSLAVPVAMMLLLAAIWLNTWPGAEVGNLRNWHLHNGTQTTTLVSEPLIGVAKSFTSFDGTNLVVDIVVRNTGSYQLTDLTLIDVLDAPEHFGAAFQSISVPPSISSTLAMPPAINPMYDGLTLGQPN
ncbi:MAG: hypothetical protein HKN76_19885, partial [Saprospiraceae bacterium]|nr:hypothetical protein [Saprospiraceae bacterium]